MDFSAYQRHAPVLLRVGLALVFLNFGIDKLRHPEVAIAMIQSSGAPALLPYPALNISIACFELAVALLLFVGLWTRVIALIAAGWITMLILMLGYWNLPHDIGLVGAALALAVLGSGAWAVDARRT